MLKIINFQKSKSSNLDVSLHIGSFFAVLVYFRNDILDFVKNKELFLKILISSIPVMIVGYLLVKTNLIEKTKGYKSNRLDNGDFWNFALYK